MANRPPVETLPDGGHAEPGIPKLLEEAALHSKAVGIRLAKALEALVDAAAMNAVVLPQEALAVVASTPETVFIAFAADKAQGADCQKRSNYAADGLRDALSDLFRRAQQR